MNSMFLVAGMAKRKLPLFPRQNPRQIRLPLMNDVHNAARAITAPSAPAGPRPHGLLWAAVIVVVLLAALLAWRFWPASVTAKRAAPPVQVRTARVERQTVPITRTGVGNVVPVMSVTVHTRVDGQLDSVSFTEGQDVKAGQVLARIDPRAYQAQLGQSLAQKAKDEAALVNARADLARYEKLIKGNAISRQELDTQRALVRQLQAAVQNDEAQIAFARVNLGYTTITAPITGRAGARLVDPGNIVRAADAGGLLVINQIDPIAVQFTLPESAFQAVNAALNAKDGDALPVQALERGTGAVLAEGKLALVNNQIDTATGTIALKGQFPNPGHKLWPGQSVNARLILGQRQQALTIPAAAVQRGQNGLYAYVIDADGKASMQAIQVDGEGDAQGGLAVITQGLAAGERVVVDGHYRLTPGAQTVEMPTAP